MIETSTQHYTAAQAHDACAQFIEAALQGNKTPDTMGAFKKCQIETDKAMNSDCAQTYIREALSYVLETIKPMLTEEFTLEQKLLHLIIIHTHRALAVDCAISTQRSMRGEQPNYVYDAVDK